MAPEMSLRKMCLGKSVQEVALARDMVPCAALWVCASAAQRQGPFNEMEFLKLLST